MRGRSRRYNEGVFDDGVIQEAGRRILQAAPPGSRLILFGSHARGEAHEHSDLDFLVIEPKVDDVIGESVRLRHTLDGMLVAADVIVRSEESVREWREVYGQVIHAALTEGRELCTSTTTDREPAQHRHDGRTRTSLDLAHQLLGRATAAELTVRTLLDVPGDLDVGIGFHASAAVEKSIKAVLAARGLRFPLTDDLRTLGEFCAESAVELPGTLEGMDELTPYAMAQFHDAPTPPASMDRARALAWASGATTWARSIVPQAEPNP